MPNDRTDEYEILIDASFESEWSALQEEIDAAGDGATIILTGDLTAAEDDLQLKIPEGKTVTIDMGGYTLDRGLSVGEPREYDARTFDVYGNLTLKNGTLTGGNGKYSEGAVTVYRNGTLDMSGVTVLNNYSRYQTGGVRVAIGAEATLTDCDFIGNTNPAFSADNGAELTIRNCSIISDDDQDRAEIRIDKDDGPAQAFNLSGSLTLKKKDGSAGRLRFEKSSVITVTGELTNTEPIPVVLTNNPTGTDVRVFTSGLVGYGTAENFASAHDGYLVVLTDDGEAALVVKKTVTFVAGGGSGEMDAAIFVAGDSWELPDCGFTAPEGKYFKAWSVKIGEANAVTMAPGDSITVSDNMTVTAIWISDWGTLQQQIDDAQNGDTITLTGNLTAAKDDAPLTIPGYKTVTIDMGGYTLDRGLDADTPNANGACMIVGDYSELTLLNGTITGASVGDLGDDGAIHLGAYSTLNMNGVTVTDNHTTHIGGAIYVDWGQA